jgi:hypothetical protein
LRQGGRLSGDHAANFAQVVGRGRRLRSRVAAQITQHRQHVPPQPRPPARAIRIARVFAPALVDGAKKIEHRRAIDTQHRADEPRVGPRR